MQEKRTFDHDTDRYRFDHGECSAERGFAQVDTGQDASYFGTWANPTTRQIVSFAEGDITEQTADTDEEFVAELRAIYDWNVASGHGFKGIDAMLNSDIEAAFRRLGCGDLLH